MTDAELRLLEEQVERIKHIEMNVQATITTLQYQLDELAQMKQQLVRLLPPEERIDRLFH